MSALGQYPSLGASQSLACLLMQLKLKLQRRQKPASLAEVSNELARKRKVTLTSFASLTFSQACNRPM